MQFTEERSVGQIVSDDYRTAQIFRKYGIDFCCGGGKKLTEACEKKGVEINTIVGELNSLDSGTVESEKYQLWSPDFLADYIVNNHHQFVRTKIPEITAYAKKLARVHGKTYPVLNDMLSVFLELSKEMLSHLEKEEKILFPYIRKLRKAETGDLPTTSGIKYSSAKEAVELMEEEHDAAGSMMKKLEEMSSGFTLPEEACTTFRVYFENLKAFRDDLHKHVHLENNILFPKTLELEGKLNG